MSVTIHHGDMREVLRQMKADGVQVQSVVCDPPYHLTSIVRRFGAEGAAPAKAKQTGAYARASRGFMGKQWDGGDIAFQAETWRLCWDLLAPGGYIVAFSGTRTYHRMACAIEDAGFDIRDMALDLLASDTAVQTFLESLNEAQRSAFLRCLAESGFGGMLAWVYGSGFPKSHDIAKAIDAREKMGSARTEDMRRARLGDEYTPTGRGRVHYDQPGGKTLDPRGDVDVGELSAQAIQWKGWGTALKPAHEPICLGRKPLEGTNADNVLKYGTGALNIDGCRIHADDAQGGDYTIKRFKPGATLEATGGGWKGEVEFHGTMKPGRWPANILHDGSDEVLAAFPSSDGMQRAVGPQFKPKAGTPVYGDYGPRPPVEPRGDSGSAARFFFQSKPDAPKCSLCCVNFAASPLPTDGTSTASFALSDAPGSPRRANADSDSLSNDHASSAARGSPQCHPPTVGSALPNVETWPLSKIGRNVLAAADLCASCATDIARALAGVRQGESEALSLSNCCIPDSKKTILRHNLASYVASRESTDTILTTTSLKSLFGCVFHAIAESTNSERSAANIGSASRRLFYSAKADHSDRLGSKHPTVKPVDLMRWLVRLVTPPGGTVLDPFAGSGTTGMACLAEGFDAVLVEREAEYVADIRRRIAHVSGEDTPLFGARGGDA